jgi:RNA polymerase sigma-70 factor (ECF subfamily)
MNHPLGRAQNKGSQKNLPAILNFEFISRQILLYLTIMFFLFALLRPATASPAVQEDEALLKKIADGQSAALGVLYDRYGRLVFSLAVHIVNDEGLAEEISQEVFMQVWNKAASYHAELGKVSTWLTSIARHRAIDSLRRRSVRPEGKSTPLDDSDDASGPFWVDPLNVESQMELTMQNNSVRLAIAQLPKEQQRALALAFFQGLSHQEIADVTGEPLGTIKTRIRLAMQKLRQVLEPSL